MSAAIPAPIPGRPLYVLYEGGRLYVSAHDRYYLEIRRGFKLKIRAAHPDVNHRSWATGRTRKLLRDREHWQEQEGRWYAHFGLDPPKRGPQGNPRPGRGSRAGRCPYRLRGSSLKASSMGDFPSAQGLTDSTKASQHHAAQTG